MILRQHLLSDVELIQIIRSSPTTEEGHRLRDHASAEWASRQRWYSPRHPGRGRWDLLVWFAAEERILPVDEMLRLIPRCQSRRDPRPTPPLSLTPAT